MPAAENNTIAQLVKYFLKYRTYMSVFHFKKCEADPFQPLAVHITGSVERSKQRHGETPNRSQHFEKCEDGVAKRKPELR